MKRAVRLLFAAAAVGLLVWTAVRQGREVADRAREVSPLTLALSLVVLLGAQACTMLAWRTLLAGLGSKLPLRSAARVFYLGQLGKYLPGSVWPVVAQVELARDLDVPRKRSAAAALLAVVVGLLAGLLVAGALLALPGAGRLRSPLWLLLVPPAVVGLVEPRLLLWGFGRLLRIARRQPMRETLPRGAMVAAGLWSLASWVFLGGHVWVLSRDLGGVPPRVAIGAFAAAWCAGFLVLLAPAGAGFREAVLSLGLAPALAAPAATVVALASRLVMTLGDLVAAGGAALLRRPARGGDEPAPL